MNETIESIFWREWGRRLWIWKTTTDRLTYLEMEVFAKWLCPHGDGNDLPKTPRIDIDVAIEIAQVFCIDYKPEEVECVKHDVQKTDRDLHNFRSQLLRTCESLHVL